MLTQKHFFKRLKIYFSPFRNIYGRRPVAETFDLTKKLVRGMGQKSRRISVVVKQIFVQIRARKRTTF